MASLASLWNIQLWKCTQFTVSFINSQSDNNCKGVDIPSQTRNMQFSEQLHLLQQPAATGEYIQLDD